MSLKKIYEEGYITCSRLFSKIIMISNHIAILVDTLIPCMRHSPILSAVHEFERTV